MSPPALRVPGVTRYEHRRGERRIHTRLTEGQSGWVHQLGDPSHVSALRDSFAARRDDGGIGSRHFCREPSLHFEGGTRNRVRARFISLGRLIE